MLEYNQIDGATTLNGEFEGHGYSGHGDGKNNPEMENVPNTGPLPRGMWEIQQPPYTHPKLGQIVFNLIPIGHDAHGRSAFRIHGDSTAHPGEASDGCIILGRAVRLAIAAAGETRLMVS